MEQDDPPGAVSDSLYGISSNFVHKSKHQISILAKTIFFWQGSGSTMTWQIGDDDRIGIRVRSGKIHPLIPGQGNAVQHKQDRSLTFDVVMYAMVIHLYGSFLKSQFDPLSMADHLAD